MHHGVAPHRRRRRVAVEPVVAHRPVEVEVRHVGRRVLARLEVAERIVQVRGAAVGIAGDVARAELADRPRLVVCLREVDHPSELGRGVDDLALVGGPVVGVDAEDVDDVVPGVHAVRSEERPRRRDLVGHGVLHDDERRVDDEVWPSGLDLVRDGLDVRPGGAVLRGRERVLDVDVVVGLVPVGPEGGVIVGDPLEELTELRVVRAGGDLGWLVLERECRRDVVAEVHRLNGSEERRDAVAAVVCTVGMQAAELRAQVVHARVAARRDRRTEPRPANLRRRGQGFTIAARAHRVRVIRRTARHEPERQRPHTESCFHVRLLRRDGIAGGVPRRRLRPVVRNHHFRSRNRRWWRTDPGVLIGRSWCRSTAASCANA